MNIDSRPPTGDSEPLQLNATGRKFTSTSVSPPPETKVSLLPITIRIWGCYMICFTVIADDVLWWVCAVCVIFMSNVCLITKVSFSGKTALHLNTVELFFWELVEIIFMLSPSVCTLPAGAKGCRVKKIHHYRGRQPSAVMVQTWARAPLCLLPEFSV